MKISNKQYAQLLFIMTQDKNAEEVEIVIKKFIQLLAKKNQIKNYSKIIKNFIQIWNKNNNIVMAEVFSANKLNENMEVEIKNFIKNKTTAKTIELKNKIDPNLIAGVIIKYGDRILDNSLKNKINNLKNNIIK